ncbi:MAG: HEAT repeat domain-containing protein [Desulfobacteraceae bacterium]|nr:HEAT repeat domain-containing protein [Desulfobacteraceae bacterium]
MQPLIEALKDKNKFVRLEAVRSLGRIGYPVALQPLIQILNNEYIRDIQISAVQALGKTGCSDAVKPLADILKKNITDDDMRANAAEALGNIGDASSAQLLVEALEDINWYVREKAAETLGKTGEPTAVQPLIRLLKDKYDFVRFMAMY